MIIVIIAGGSGTRLWPLSQENYPKHLLRLTGEASLLQEAYARAKLATGNIYIVSEISHSHEVAKQLPELPTNHLIIEPGRRGTASCIILALSKIKQNHPDETVVFVHADHNIADTKSFANAVRSAAAASESAKKITLIGLKPSYPATGFGYIKTGDQTMESHGLPVLAVDKFVEKPKLPVARRYVANGQYLWNLGLFAAPLPVFEQNLRQFAPELNQAYHELSKNWLKPKALRKIYLDLPSRPIDTALIEKTDQIQVIPGQFDWADIGSFLELHKLLQDDSHNALKGDVHLIDCEDSMVHGSDKPIIAIGLSGIVVVDTPEGLLVCAKEKSQQVGDAVKAYYSKIKPKA